MNDQTKPTEDPTLAALRERANGIVAELNAMELTQRVLEARLAEINATIEIVVRNGRKKPGPKPGGPRVVETSGTSPALPLDAGEAA
jgi:hypothetical protein